MRLHPTSHSKSELIPQCTAWAGLALAAILLFMGPAKAAAYDTWSVARDATNCQACHGDYRNPAYASMHDGVSWNGDLHDGHRYTWINRDCDFCHGATRFPVVLNSSNKGLGCTECHGRFEPNAGGKITGSGLRQHHDRSGITVCRSCHTDSNPSLFKTAGESELPPFYRTADAAYPLKPRNACNTDGLESTPAPPLGLDNDGDLVYDSADSDCNVTGVGETNVTPGLALIGVLPNPITSGTSRLQVLFSLPRAGPALVELFDIQGRLVARRQIPAASFGRNGVELESPRGTFSGVYFLRLAYAGKSITKKVVMMR